MCFRTTLLLAAALTLCADLPDLPHFRPPGPGDPDIHALSSVSPADVFVWVVAQAKREPTQMGEQSKLSIIRYVDGEFAKALQPLPHEKTGYKIQVGKPLNVKDLQDEIRREGAIANPGDTVQITKIEFRSREIAVQINGGGRKKFHLREHLQISMGDVPPPATSDHPDEGHGTTIILDYGRALPDLSPDDVKRDLAVFLDFSKHSAAVNWLDTLPPEIQQAIRDHRATVGMDQEMVIAAIGRPDHKVRERDPSGTETEDWIYGIPPAKTTFVTFVGDKVVRVKVFNDPGATGAN
ncbi:MAG TPA: hypothetical protein VLY23_07865 [Candidatus Acidoferrum sp.]|nr:hypothetical protein [Candidatus Acidoferrum sp.]